MKGHHLYKIFLWKKADIISLSHIHFWGIFDAVKTFIEVNTISTKINSLWEHFSNMCQELLDEHVPSKMTSVRYSQILINTEINRLSRKASKKINDWDHYKSIKTKCQMNVVKHITTMSAQC